MPQQWGTEYRVQAKDKSGRPVQGYIVAASFLAARQKAKTVAKAQQWALVSVRSKKTFSYKVRRGTRVIEGLQNAYTRQEVVAALKRLGFEVRKVRRYFDFRMRASTGELVTFIGVSTKLLEQKIPYNEVLRLMATNVKDKYLRGAIRDIIKDLKNGLDSREAFERQGKVLGPDTALMLGIGSKSGDIKSIFQSVARFVERQAEFKKGMASSMILPAVTFVTLFGAIAFYVLYLLPEMQQVMGPNSEVPPLTAITLDVSSIIQENFTLITVSTILTVVGFYTYIMTQKGRLAFHRYIVRIPYVGGILRNTSVEMFCRVLGILYSSSGENVDVINRAAESSRNRYLEKQIKTVALPSMLKYGTELALALEWTKFFPDMVISRFRTAGETGNVKATAMQLADFYEMENHYSMKNLVTVIEVAITVIIMFSMMFLTFLSSETATIKIETFNP